MRRTRAASVPEYEQEDLLAGEAETQASVVYGPPTFDFEHEAADAGFRLIAGVDEVGRGAIAGPVAAGAVILPPGLEAPWLDEVRDSKQLTPAQRERLAPLIKSAAAAYAVAMASQEYIDQRGIVPATRRAMGLALQHLSPGADFVLIDALMLPEVRLRQRSIIHGDALSMSIACASIIAKVTRDHLMCEMSESFPVYGFAGHKGYATPEHLAELEKHGPCPLHRRSFRPLAQERLL